MIRRLTAILLTLLIFSFGAKELTIYLGFKWNQDTIASKLCVNVNEPQVMCSGKCFLGQQLVELKVQNDGGDQFPVVSLEIAKVFYNSNPFSAWKAKELNHYHTGLFSYQIPVTNPVAKLLFRPPIIG